MSIYNIAVCTATPEELQHRETCGSPSSDVTRAESPSLLVDENFVEPLEDLHKLDSNSLNGTTTSLVQEIMAAVTPDGNLKRVKISHKNEFIIRISFIYESLMIITS